MGCIYFFARPHTSIELTARLKQKEGDMGSGVEENPFGLIFQKITQPSGWLQDFIKKKKKGEKKAMN